MLTGHLIDHQIDDRLWVVTSRHTLRFRGRTHALPCHFLTDYASIPDIFHCILRPRDDEYDEAAMWHDYLVRHRKTLDISLSHCHDAFSAILKYRNCTSWKRRAMVQVVRWVNWAVAGNGNGEISYRINDDALNKYAAIVARHPCA